LRRRRDEKRGRKGEREKGRGRKIAAHLPLSLSLLMAKVMV
jgi:hypothetical protein